MLLPAPAAFPHIMDGLPGVFINDGGLCVLGDDPVCLVIEHTLMGFVRDALHLLIDRGYASLY